MTEYHHARLIAIDNWPTAQSAMTSRTDRIAAVAQALGISEFGAQSVLVMAEGPLPERRHVEANLNALDYLRRLIDGDR
ncbi:MAG: hypothetical protein ACRDO7_02015 [Nocardioidaceae bacterium]